MVTKITSNFYVDISQIALVIHLNNNQYEICFYKNGEISRYETLILDKEETEKLCIEIDKYKGDKND